jgi:hypothetical protein
MLVRGLIGAIFAFGLAHDAAGAEADTAMVTPRRARPTASAPT